MRVWLEDLLQLSVRLRHVAALPVEARDSAVRGAAKRWVFSSFAHGTTRTLLHTTPGVMALSARDLMQVMARYREPSRARSVFELVDEGVWYAV
jgi:hypothetical protein